MRRLITLALILASPAMAQEWNTRGSDAMIARGDLDTLLRGRILTFYDGGQSEFYGDGRYTYTYANEGGTAYGYWDITADSTVCLRFVHGAARCDYYVRDADRLVLITEGGDRFPIRPTDG